MQEKVNSAIERLKLAANMSDRYFNKPLEVCISGGKDSSVIQHLAIESGVTCRFIHNLTTADAPETVRFVKDEFHYLKTCLGYSAEIQLPPISMWKLIVKKKYPPTRLARYCCEVLKERAIKEESFVVTGVRWAESPKRKATRATYEVRGNTVKDIIKTDDDPERMLFETCIKNRQRVCNPIIDWTDDDVWEYLKSRSVTHNPLYDEGRKRVGCVGCPLAPKCQRMKDFERWPKYKENYIRAFDKMIIARKESNLKCTWESGQEVFDWWVDNM